MKKLFLAFTLSLILCAHASADDLEDEKASYDTQAEQKLEESGRIQAEIDSISEEKRLIDIETDDAVAKYRVLKGELDEIENRIEENTEKLKELEVEREKKQKILA